MHNEQEETLIVQPEWIAAMALMLVFFVVSGVLRQYV